MSTLFALILLFSCEKEASLNVPQFKSHPIVTSHVDKPDRTVADILFNRRPSRGPNTNITNNLGGGTFIYRPAGARLIVDSGIVFPAKDGGFWEREVADTVKLSWYNISSKKADNAGAIKTAIQAAIKKNARVVTFPARGIYHVAASNYWSVGDRFNLTIDGNGSTIIVDGKAAALAQETYVIAFKCTDLNSLNSSVTVKRLNIRAPDITPKWTNKNYADHRLVMAIETDGIHNVTISNCSLSDICGYGIRLKNFGNAAISEVTENNVGGHFPIENEHDSFGDGIWLGHYDVQTDRPSRKKSYARISGCVFKGYNAVTNGNFASRCGITVEGFNSHGNDIAVKVDVSNTTVSGYDRNLHVEGISAGVTYTNCTLRNFFGIGLFVNSPQTTLTYNHTTASGLLKANPQQEHYGLGGIMQFNSSLDVYLRNKSTFTLNGPASFRANIYLEDRSVLDFANSDIFFDHANLHLKSGGSIINVPPSVPRGFNMYGGTIDLSGGTIAGTRGNKGVFHGESIDAANTKGCKLSNSRLLFNGKCGYIEVNN